MYDQIRRLAEGEKNNIASFWDSLGLILALSSSYMFSGCAHKSIKSLKDIESPKNPRTVYSIDYTQEEGRKDYEVSFTYRENLPIDVLPEDLQDEIEREEEFYLSEEEKENGDRPGEYFNYIEAEIEGVGLPPGGLTVKLVDLYGADDIGGQEAQSGRLFEELPAAEDEPDLVYLESGWFVGLSESFTKDDIGSEVNLDTNLKDIHVSGEETERIGRIAEEKYQDVRWNLYWHLENNREGREYRPDAVGLKDRLMDILGL